MSTSLGKLPDHVLKPKQPPISHDNHGKENHPLHLVNAMLHVSDKDGIPFFAFKSNAKGGILVARKKKVLMPGNDNFECVYAFHCVREVEKRGARRMMHQSKGKKLETRITGQMMVSSTISKSLGMLGEFVVFGVDSSEGGNEALDFLPNNQLAAIVMSLPKDGSTEEILNWKVRVILPSGVHAFPRANAVPSSLIDGWRSGGSCDCGGWDLGCTLTVLGNEEQPDPNNYQSSSTSCDTFSLDLFIKVVIYSMFINIMIYILFQLAFVKQIDCHTHLSQIYDSF